ncbi:hypothetical protein BGZ75_010228 [Mortierella antarctica]|nr:hypothetical protein BGZ75_010228 [Mortierella antarctica]
MVQALCLPEILATVGLFLDLDDLASCLCVCKTWHATFLPLRWRDVRIAGIHSVCADVQIRRHAHLVRSLAFLHIVSLKHFQSVDRYDRLERIHITKTDIDGRKVWDKIAALVRQNRPTLRTMILEDMMPPPEFLMTLTEQEYEESGRGRTINSAGQFHLRHLAWRRVTVYGSSLGHFWRASQGAHTLILECLMIKKEITVEIAPNPTAPWVAALSTSPQVPAQGSTQSSMGLLPTLPSGTSASSLSTSDSSLEALLGSSTTTGPSCKVQSLRVSWIIDLPLDLQLTLWIQPCQELRSLIWEAFTFPDPFVLHFSRLLATNTWPFLTSLEISSCVTHFPTDYSLAQLLNADAGISPVSLSAAGGSNSSSSMNRLGDGTAGGSARRTRSLERLVFRNVDFGPLAFKSLRGHFRTLKTLLLVACATKVTSAMAREILESCPRLEYFQAPYLFVEDVRIPSEDGDMTCAPGEHDERVQKADERGVGGERWRSDTSNGSIDSPSHQEHEDGHLRDHIEESAKGLAREGSPASAAAESAPKPWVCRELRSLYISASTVSYSSPPLTEEEEAVIYTRLRRLKKLQYFYVGATISSAPF